jgi:outer membrane protein assembly factor BamD
MPRVTPLILVLPLLAGCSRTLDPELYPTAESLYDASVEAYRTGDCRMARQGFQRLVFELPPQDERHASVRYYLGECMMQQAEELEAAMQFRRVADDYPRHPLAPDGLLRAGDAYAELWNDAELDPTYGETALATYTELIGRFPTSPAAERARLRIADLNEMFAEKGYKNGVFYYRLKAFDSAMIYFKDVVLKYPASDYAAQSVVKLIETYDRIGYVEERDQMCLYLRQYYPGTGGVEERCSSGA